MFLGVKKLIKQKRDDTFLCQFFKLKNKFITNLYHWFLSSSFKAEGGWSLVNSYFAKGFIIKYIGLCGK